MQEISPRDITNSVLEGPRTRHTLRSGAMKGISPKRLAESFSGRPHNQSIAEAIRDNPHRQLELEKMGGLLKRMNVGEQDIPRFKKVRAWHTQLVGAETIRSEMLENLNEPLGEIAEEMDRVEFFSVIKTYLEESYDFHKRNGQKQGHEFVSLQDARIVIMSQGLTGHVFTGEPTIINSAKQRFATSLTGWMLGR